MTRTWTATDDCGNSSSCSRTISVTDNTAPTITCPNPAPTVECPATPSFGSATATDACDGSVVPSFNDVTTPGTCPQEYSVTRTWTATDDCGNSSSCSRTISVTDNTAPTITCPNPAPTVECPATPNFGNATATDACDGSVVPTYNDVNTPGACLQEYSVTRTWTATDDCGNSSTCSRTIYVEDNTPPTISCPQALTVQCAGQVPAYDPYAATANDVCGDVTRPTVADQITSGSCPNRYTIIRTYRATDACGLSSSCTQTITVWDDTAPTGSCPSIPNVVAGCIDDIPCTAAEALASLPAGTLNTIAAGFSDNCGGPITVEFDHFGPLSECENGFVTRTVFFRVRDNCGNVRIGTCPVTFQAPCYEFCTYTQGYYGNEGGQGQHLALITSLMNANGNIVIGIPGERSLTITSPECVVQFLPGGSTAAPLKPGNPVATSPDCDLGTNPTENDGRLRNNLASNAIALQLNLWNNPGLENVPLNGCISFPTIPGYSPANVGALMALVNQYLGGALGNNGSLGGALTNAVTAINEYWDNCSTHNPCSGASYAGFINQEEEMEEGPQTVSIVPNPASDFVTISFEGYENQEVSLMIYNDMGQRMLHSEMDWTISNSLRVDLNGYSSGIYFVLIQSNETSKVLKFVVTGR